MTGVLVIAEHRAGELRAPSLEAIAAAQRVARPGEEICVALLAADPDALAGGLEGAAARLICLAHPELAEYNPELYLAALLPLIEELSIRLIILPHTSQGIDLGPAIAGRLGVGIVTDCSDLSARPELNVTRGVYGGKVIETSSLDEGGRWVLTLQVGLQTPAGDPRATTIERRALETLNPRHPRRFLRRIDGAGEDVEIASADILVAVGRGIGKAENVALAQELAEAVGGSVACSRPVADAGWLPKSRQVGTSGKSVRPRLYIALGISGAFQHQAGMRGSASIIAVNKDPAAPIFDIADYGVVGDLMEVVPNLIKELS